MTDTLSVLIKDLHADFLDEVERTIRPFAIPLCTEDRLVGSGTLISWDDRCGILTAQHVPVRGGFKFHAGSDQRLATVLRQGAHFFSLPTQYLRLIEIGVPESEADGPDLAVIEIPQSLPELSRLRAVKSFWNLSMKTEGRLRRSLEDGDMAALVGNPGELVQERGPEAGFDGVRQLYGMTGFGGIGRRYTSGDFDFFEFDVNYSPSSSLPDSFGGVSGGGVWVVPLRRETADAPVVLAQAPILAGVAFYQGAREGDRCKLLCHGGRSIYDVVLRRLRG